VKPSPRRARPLIRLPRRLRTTPEGKFFVLITFAVGAAAMNTGNNLLYVALCMNLSLIIVSGVLSEWTLRGIRLTVRPASEAFAGRNAFLAVTCSAAGKRFPGFSLAARLEVGGDTASVRFPNVRAGATATCVVTYRPAHRGFAEGATAILSTRFPFSLFEKSLDLAIPGKLLVYPRPLPSERPDLRGVAPGSDDAPRGGGRPGAFPRGARERLPTDPVRDIHWKASARMGRWMVKEREYETAPAVEIRVSVVGPAEAFERRLSTACGTVIDLDRRRVPFRLWIGDRLCADSREPSRRAVALEGLATACRGAAGPPQ
jgi:uncharacterized protein (DUF58 family)